MQYNTIQQTKDSLAIREHLNSNITSYYEGVAVLLTILFMIGGIWKYVESRIDKVKKFYDGKIDSSINDCKEKCNMKFQTYDQHLIEFKTDKDASNKKLDKMNETLIELRISVAEILTFVKGAIPENKGNKNA